ncbi:anti-sigma factor [Mechercharimyces sp. CAU 1602]|uniref:anti-sigma factor family protein n=1 Tax=Mechercharimyces sp. CAU 1602 TaxID=2973933 RepID=UPI002163B8B9|nr:zf-HC2 domain-containing protein [Mechercharimyces sp. CAU 1602]MCS1350109.1 zf-HC2 domain-containing protein [Mechercharimyces sp. CAU 1602]
MMSCREIEPLIQRYVDQEISKQEYKKLKAHVDECAECKQDLQEMIELVHTLEEIRIDRQHKERASFNGFPKWAVVCASMMMVVYFFPPYMESSIQPSADQNATSVTLSTAQTSQSGVVKMPETGQDQVMVLAKQSEELHIPAVDSIRVVQSLTSRDSGQMSEVAWVYPSAVPLVIEEQAAWQNNVKRVVFVRIPDRTTLLALLGLVGMEIDDEKEKLERLTYPTSVIVTTGEQPEWKTFRFPEDNKEVLHWFHKLMDVKPVHP